jgi:glutathione S-transferase
MPKLYHFPLCAFSRRARLALGEYGLDAELIEEQTWQRRQAFLKLNPAGTTPVFVDDDDTVIAGIEALGEYLEENRTQRKSYASLMPRGALARAETRRLIAWFDVKFNAEVTCNLVIEKVYRRFMPADQGGGAPNMNAVRAGMANIKYHLDYIGHLASQRNWLAGEDLSLADLAAAAHLSCIDYLGDVPWSAHDTARSWYQRIKSRPAFRSLLADAITGIAPPRGYADLDF